AEGGSGTEIALETDYFKACTALTEVNLQSLCPFFKEQGLNDEILSSLQSEEELNEFLVTLFVERLQPFAKVWFQKYHGNTADIGTPRPFGTEVGDFFYEKGSKLKATENRVVEFKSFSGAPPVVVLKHSMLTWKMMDKAKNFICGCLNADRKGVIYFGVKDQDGEILGLEIEGMKDEIVNAFQAVLNDHITNDAGKSLSTAEQDCIKRHFVPVKSQGNPTGLYVIEIEVARDWKFSEDKVYYSKMWKEKDGNSTKGPNVKALKDFYNVKPGEWDDVQIRTDGQTSKVKKEEVHEKVKKPLQKKYEEWKSNANQDCTDLLLTDEELIAEKRNQVCTESLLVSIYEEVATCWRQLAPQLGIDAVTCDIIEADYKNSVVERGSRLLIKWRQKDASKATVGRLADALVKIQKKQFAEKLLNEVKIQSASP
ncbi:uncharacterized protein LOC144641039, partial [Oculina patagonica]